MKKIITLVLALAMAVSLFTGCGKKNIINCCYGNSWSGCVRSEFIK
jgi:hypothetical protein